MQDGHLYSCDATDGTKQAPYGRCLTPHGRRIWR